LRDICTLSLHDALPISGEYVEASLASSMAGVVATEAATTTLNELFRLVGSSAARRDGAKSSVFELYLRNIRLLSLQDSVDTKKGDRKSTRLNSSHVKIS